MLFEGKSEEYLLTQIITVDNCHLLKEKIEGCLNLLWIQEGETRLVIDNKNYIFTKNQIVCLTEFHKIEVIKVS